MFSKKQREIFHTGTHEQVLEVIKEEAQDYDPTYFDHNSWNWETVFSVIKFNSEDRPGRVPFPQWTFEHCHHDLGYDFSYPRQEIHFEARENPLYAATKEGDELLEELKDRFEEIVNDNFDLLSEYKNVLRHVRDPLWLFLPFSAKNLDYPPKMTLWAEFGGTDQDHIYAAMDSLDTEITRYLNRTSERKKAKLQSAKRRHRAVASEEAVSR